MNKMLQTNLPGVVKIDVVTAEDIQGDNPNIPVKVRALHRSGQWRRKN